jgi:hypothetical protein
MSRQLSVAVLATDRSEFIELPLLEKTQRTMSVYFQADPAADGSMTFDLDVVFQSIVIEAPGLQRAICYVASTGGEVELEAKKGMALDLTGSAEITVQHTNTRAGASKSNIKIAPKFKAKGLGIDVEAQAGEIETARDRDNTDTAAYTVQEALIGVTVAAETVRWQLSLPRGERVMRDFLLGNYQLLAQCSWRASADRSGHIRYRPVDVAFFDHHRRPVSDEKRLLTWYLLWKTRRLDFGEIDVKFTVVENE